MAEITLYDATTGEIIGRQRGKPEALDKLLAKLDPAKVRVEQGWAELPPKTRPGPTIQVQRNRLLAQWEWTVSPASPLTKACQQEWMAYLKALHRVTKGLADPSLVVWPTVPGLVYDDAA